MFFKKNTKLKDLSTLSLNHNYIELNIFYKKKLKKSETIKSCIGNSYLLLLLLDTLYLLLLKEECD